MKTGNILATFLVGAGIGAVIGILIAPDKGSETRKKLAKGAQDLAENLKTRIENISNGIEEFPDDLEHKNKQEFYERAFSQSLHTSV